MALPFKSLLGALHHALFSLRYALRSAVWKPAQAMARPSSKNLIISGYFNEALGIGRAGQLVANAMEMAGYQVCREDLRPFDRGLVTRRAYSFPEGRAAAIWLIEANPPEAKIALFSHDYKVWKKLYRIAFWHWESDLAPENWVRIAPWFHEIWVSSAFVLKAVTEAMRQAGLADQIVKLHLYPLPVDVPETSFAPANHMPVKVISLFDPRSDFERKNPLAVLEAWLQCFPQPSDKACLIIKALDHAADHPQFAPLQKLAQGRSDIAFQCQTLSYHETMALIKGCDILISLHRGEGFGLTMAEAMTMGVSVIATGWSGNLQFMTSDNSILIPYNLVPANTRYNGPQAQWADPDISAAAKALSLLIHNPDLRAALSQQAQLDMSRLRQTWFD